MKKVQWIFPIITLILSFLLLNNIVPSFICHGLFMVAAIIQLLKSELIYERNQIKWIPYAFAWLISNLQGVSILAATQFFKQVESRIFSLFIGLGLNLILLSGLIYYHRKNLSREIKQAILLISLFSTLIAICLIFM